MKKAKIFNKQERLIIKVLIEERRPMSIRDIAKEATLSWVTVKKYLNKLKDGFVVEVKEGWELQDKKRKS